LRSGVRRASHPVLTSWRHDVWPSSRHTSRAGSPSCPVGSRTFADRHRHSSRGLGRGQPSDRRASSRGRRRAQPARPRLSRTRPARTSPCRVRSRHPARTRQRDRKQATAGAQPPGWGTRTQRPNRATRSGRGSPPRIVVRNSGWRDLSHNGVPFTRLQQRAATSDRIESSSRAAVQRDGATRPTPVRRDCRTAPEGDVSPSRPARPLFDETGSAVSDAAYCPGS
jgi:hypothetical protein